MRLVLAMTLLAATACQPDETTDTDPEVDTQADVEEAADGPILDDGVVSTIDSSGDWAYFDLDTLSEVTSADADDWDIAFQMFTVHVNGGDNGSGGVEVVALNGEYDAWGTYGETGHPESGWATDSGAAVMSGWYNYDSATHIVTPGDVRYFIRSTQGSVFEFRVLDYYDDQDQPHFFTFETADRTVP